MKVNDNYEVLIDRFNHQGKGICSIDGRTVFVSNALPLEKVLINIDHVSSKFISGSVIEYKSFNSNRVKPVCPYYDDCGGCNIMHMNYNYQCDFKFNKVKDIIKKFVREDIKINKIISGEQFFYRNKATFHVSSGIGYYKEKTYELISIDKCLLCSKRINDIFNILKCCDLKNIDDVVIRSGINDSVMVVLNAKGHVSLNTIEVLKKHVNSIYVNDKLVYGDLYIIDKIGNYEFVISPKSFFQVNTNMAYKLYSKVLEYCGDLSNKCVLDLYCGTGTIGLFVSSNCKKLVGIEICDSAVNDANINKKINGVDNAMFICGDSGSELKKLNYNPDIVIVDPPRSGLDSLAINEVISLNSSKVIYVSCDPITLARDLNIFKEYYNIIEISLVDMFPNTDHCETICVLERK